MHLDHDNCLEVLVVKGKASEVRAIADALISTKGVKHGRLTITSSGAGPVIVGDRHRHSEKCRA